MNIIDYHLYLLFVAQQQFFGINIKNIKKLYRLDNRNEGEGFFLEGFSNMRIGDFEVINIEKTLFSSWNSQLNKNPWNHFEIVIPTLIELVSATNEITAKSTGIIVDFVVGLHQIPPDEFNTCSDEDHNQLFTFNQNFIVAQSSFPLTNRASQLIETPVFIIHTENLIADGVKLN
ncbi:MAG: hypothetical protein OEV66_06535 [Spirochaetia bacterium]|nr:hypothetical protein [Spirochaetia bacterium]